MLHQDVVASWGELNTSYSYLIIMTPHSECPTLKTMFSICSAWSPLKSATEEAGKGDKLKTWQAGNKQCNGNIDKCQQIHDVGFISIHVWAGFGDWSIKCGYMQSTNFIKIKQ
jgi:hypothetical protein